MACERIYTDEQLVVAVGWSTSWRGVMGELGLASTSSGTMRSVRSHAGRLKADYRHFRGRRRWTEEQLRTVVQSPESWAAVVKRLDLKGRSAVLSLKGHVVQLVKNGPKRLLVFQ